MVLIGCHESEPREDSRQAAAASAVETGERILDDSIHWYFETFPSRATAAGVYDFDDRLENLSPRALETRSADNRARLEALGGVLEGELPDALRVDLELLERATALDAFDLDVARRPRRDPLFWTGIIANATVFQLVRDDRPLEGRLRLAARRAEGLPTLAAQAIEALSDGDGGDQARELFALAGRQMRASSAFYRDGFAGAADGIGDEAARAEVGQQLAAVGARVSAALETMADQLEALAERATGSPRLGVRYAERFGLYTGDPRSVDEVLRAAEAALADKRTEAAAFGRSIWPDVMSEPPPTDDRDVLRALFDRIADDHADSTDAFIDHYRRLLDDSVRFVREHDVVTLPEPLTVHIARSPDFFLGQGVGGVYPAGPFAPEADTLFYLPTPASGASDEARTALFRDFNEHFNVMIMPHEMVPGHYLQLKYAARHPRKVRALFGDSVFIEGWGTFCERLMLDLGWGGPLDRVAHLKKQLENIARTIVDIRVHTGEMSRDEVIDFVREEALQADHFAANMWMRAITSSPQLTTYWLGYEAVTGLYRDARAASGEDFVLREFSDAVMTVGPIPVARLRERLLD